jgi:hypothetical protein
VVVFIRAAFGANLTLARFGSITGKNRINLYAIQKLLLCSIRAIFLATKRWKNWNHHKKTAQQIGIRNEPPFLQNLFRV